jgi:hypothetical protein
MLSATSKVPRHRFLSKLQGSCLCGSIKWELEDAFVSQICVCHCCACQRHSGSTSIPFCAVERMRLWPLLKDQATLKGYQSSKIATRYFCCTCGTPVVHDYHEEKHTLWIPMGSLVMDASTCEVRLDPKKDSHIFCEEAASYERASEHTLPRCRGFGLYKVDPCQPAKDWKDLPTLEDPVSLVEMGEEMRP